MMGFAWFRRRRKHAAPAPEPAPGTDPADELRRKLDQSRGSADEPVVPPPPEPSVEERRRDVHERARESIERMRGDAPPQ